MFDVPKSAILNDPTETLIRRGRWKNKPKNTAFVFDQKTERWRPPAAVFLPRPQKDRSLSVNIESSLLAANLPSDWGVDHENFYAVRLTVGSCVNHGLLVARDPVEGNPHHGAIMGIVELRDEDNDAFQSLVTDLAKQSEILSESLEIFELAEKK